MTITNTVASKLFVGFVAIAMALSLVAPAQAATEAELQAQIDQLMATINSLQAQVGQTPAGDSSAAVCPYAWTRSLSSGSTGADVMALQKFLNADTATQVSASGAGSAGMETQYFGPATAAAVSNFQVKYRDEILTPAGLVNPTGYFGPSSMAKANALCATAAPGTDDEDEDGEGAGDDEDMELSGEASLDTFETEDAEDDEIEEGEEDAPIAEMTVEFTDGDAEISRLDISLLGDGESDTSTVRPWDAFETISVWVDGDMVAEFDASDEDEYLDEDAGTIRFANLGIFAEEDEELEITIGATVGTGLDSEELATWDVQAQALRFFDADGVATTEDDAPVTDDTASFTIGEEGTEDELIAKTSTNDPDGTTLQVEDDSDSDWYTVFVFDLDTDDSVNDIEINSIKVNASTTLGSYNTLVDDAELVINGVTIDDVVVTNGASTAVPAVLTFDVDGDVVIDAGDRVEAELRLKFNALDSGDEGATVKGSISSLTTSIVTAEGADDLENAQLSGAATGDAHTLRTQGVDVAAGDIEAEVTVVDGDDNDYGTYTMELEITAFEQDVYIDVDPSNSVSYVMEDGAGNTISGFAASSTVVLSSSGEEIDADDVFEITEGSTETLTIEVTFEPGLAGSTAARMNLNSITFGSSSGTPTGQTWTASPNEDYRTSVITIQN